ncbi:MAG: hypothetical protein ACXWEV_04885 [Methylobacter sp.]
MTAHRHRADARAISASFPLPFIAIADRKAIARFGNTPAQVKAS